MIKLINFNYTNKGITAILVNSMCHKYSYSSIKQFKNSKY